MCFHDVNMHKSTLDDYFAIILQTNIMASDGIKISTVLEKNKGMEMWITKWTLKTSEDIYNTAARVACNASEHNA